MPKLIDYPRTTYAGAWELCEVVDDTGGKCAIDTAARKLNRKVSGSFKAIIGSAVKFGLLTSKRDLLSTTTLFRRIKHAYDKQEELVFHREAFLTPPLFTQLCRKFRSRELPVQMLDVMLIREFGVEEINAQGVARAFVEGARMVGLLDEHNTVADIDQLAALNPPRRELASPQPSLNSFRATSTPAPAPESSTAGAGNNANLINPTTSSSPQPALNAPTAPLGQNQLPPAVPRGHQPPDAVASLFGLGGSENPASGPKPSQSEKDPLPPTPPHAPERVPEATTAPLPTVPPPPRPVPTAAGYHLQINGPGIDTQLTITDEDDLLLVQAVLNKIRRQLNS